MCCDLRESQVHSKLDKHSFHDARQEASSQDLKNDRFMSIKTMELPMRKTKDRIFFLLKSFHNDRLVSNSTGKLSMIETSGFLLKLLQLLDSCQAG